MDAAARIYFGVSARHVDAVAGGGAGRAAAGALALQPAGQSGRCHGPHEGRAGAMVETGAITQAQAEAASASIAFPPAPAIAAGWFADWAAAQAAQDLSPNADATLHTTLDYAAASGGGGPAGGAAGQAGEAAGATQGAVGDPRCGERRGACHGRRRDYRSGSFNRAVEARRPARLGIQAVHLVECVAAWANAGFHGAGCADPYRPLEPGELRAAV